MKNKILQFMLFLSSIVSYAQTYDFSSDPFAVGSGWIHEQDNPIGFSYNTLGHLDCNITASNETNLLYRPLPNPLQDMFSISFKINLEDLSNGFFPLVLTPTSYVSSTPNTHPWRENSTGLGAGNFQTGDFLSVHISDNNGVRIITRVGTSVSSSVSVLNLDLNTDYWIELERICPTKVRLSVYESSAMLTPLDQLVVENNISITNLTPVDLNFLYIANGNGNWTTNIVGELDDYVINRKKCPCDPEILGNSIVCEPGLGGTYSIDLGSNVENVNWSISPGGPDFVTSSSLSGVYSLVVNDWVEPGDYTITLTWECNCKKYSLTFEVTVQQSILDIDPVLVDIACNSLGNNTLDFTALATGGTGVWRNWYVYESENMTSGDYTISSTNPNPILVNQNNVASISMNGLSMANGYIIKCIHGYDNGVCPSDTTYKKVVCIASRNGKIIEKNTFIDDSKPRIYPNPTTKDLNIILPSKSNINRINIVDALGSVIEEKRLDNNNEETKVSFVVEKLNPGTYFVVYTTNSNEKIIDKFINN